MSSTCSQPTEKRSSPAGHVGGWAFDAAAVLDEAFHAAEGSRDLDQLELGDDAECCGLSALQFERHHAAEAASHLPLRDGVLRVARKAGIRDARDRGMCFKALCETERAAARLRDAQMQGAHAAQQQPGFERAEDGAADAAFGVYVGPDRQCCIARGDDAGDDIRMAVEIFGGGVENEIRAVLERAGEDGRGRGGIDGEQRARSVCGAGGGGDVDHLIDRVHRRFDPDDFGFAGPERGGESFRLARIEQGDVQCAAFALLLQPANDAEIAARS